MPLQVEIGISEITARERILVIDTMTPNISRDAQVTAQIHEDLVEQVKLYLRAGLPTLADQLWHKRACTYLTSGDPVEKVLPERAGVPGFRDQHVIASAKHYDNDTLDTACARQINNAIRKV